MEPNKILLSKNMMVQSQSNNRSLMDMIMDWHNISQNKRFIHSPLTFPCYLNYEKYGNGLNRHLLDISEYIKSRKLMDFEGFNDYIEMNMVYPEDQGHPSLERLMRYIDENGEEGRGFHGVVLLHIDEWCSQVYRLLDKRFLAMLQYLEERRSRLLIIFQTTSNPYSELLEKQLQQRFNIRVIESKPLSMEYIIDEITSKLQGYGFQLNDEAIQCIETLTRSFMDVEEIDCFQQMKLIIEDVIYEYMKDSNSNDMLITDKHFHYSLKKNKQITSKNEQIVMGFEYNH
ncbi:MAG: hypothetical protein GX915_03360 [Clostridiales bacterium]|nr:hypothetical protein [Clostridiales bacterium]